MASDSIARMLHASFRVLEAELPSALGRVVAGLDGMAISIQVDDEVFVVAVAGRVAVMEPADAPNPSVHIVTGSHAILDVLDDVLTLEDAVLSDRVRVTGALDHLQACHAALLAYVHGGVRTRGFPLLVARLRRYALGGAAAD